MRGTFPLYSSGIVRYVFTWPKSRSRYAARGLKRSIHTLPQNFSEYFQLVMDHPKFIVINKNCGVPVQDDSKRFHHTRQRKGLQTMLSEIDPQIRGVHRLDKCVTGGIVFAKDKRTAAMISRNLKQGGNSGYKLTRRYVGLLRLEDLIKTGHSPSRQRLIGTVHSKTDNGRIETTRFILPWVTSGGYTIAIIELETGRKHQIRRHFGEILKWPLINDVKYGASGIEIGSKSAIGLHSAYVNLKIGSSEHQCLIPPVYATPIWSGFLGNDGQFTNDISQLLLNFTTEFESKGDGLNVIYSNE
ncbi:CYFA0S18e00364g1_1 [Cyberlindnera fabianii]|uniref:21S rRNA pseudouridine(2819) synthase n=1 Tax=Cyberlindnera fabianii TaxID=36022 RepID=A0A061BBV9_CYBFA|nr:CYFA0S18e00364g1_1 [Cyberlindnera fabianii]